MLRAYRGISEDKGDPDACAVDHGGECIPVFPVAEDVVDLIVNVRDKGGPGCLQTTEPGEPGPYLGCLSGTQRGFSLARLAERLEAFADEWHPLLCLVLFLVLSSLWMSLCVFTARCRMWMACAHSSTCLQ